MKYTVPEDGFVLLIDKPYGWTSFQVVNKVRWLIKRKTGKKKVKVGHAGTLDPLATGLLILCVGKQTKNIATLTGQDKSYAASLRMGLWSPSYDLEKRVIPVGCTPQFNETQWQETLEQFRGIVNQRPPAFSAKRVKGKRAYEAARAGNIAPLKSQEVHILQLEAQANRWPNVDFQTSCSKGTYIRSLAHDIGIAYGSAAVLTALRRTHIGNFKVADAVSMTEISQHLNQKLIPVNGG